MASCTLVSADVEPIVHDIFAPSSQTWQYVVVDPSTDHCVLIDPVMDPSNKQLSTKPADDVLEVVCQNRYKVDMIVETHASNRDNRSGAWYLRMQLRDIQGFPPRVSQGPAVSGMEKLFARKYGTTLQTKLDGDFRDGEAIDIGRMSMKVLHLPGICTPGGRGYQIGTNLFGGHSIADLKNRMQQDSFTQEISTMSEDESHALWESLQKILGLPLDYRIYFDRGEPDLSVTPRVRFNSDGNDDPRASNYGGDRGKGVLKTAFTTVGHCRAINNHIEATAAEFMKKWEESRSKGVKVASVAAAPEHRQQQITPKGGGEKSAKDADSVPVKKASRVGGWFRSSKEKS